ncbi:hypothetical protein ACRALDRAFT_2015210 [Sodiomyces alcalophilus JCM 7366]|uniref:uncharacterized protein n=1 Tax=Sodiomyces alcalophilus JCM 7366 TaxID=591952 RepID=UPI0039B5297E
MWFISVLHRKAATTMSKGIISGSPFQVFNNFSHPTLGVYSRMAYLGNSACQGVP